MNPDELPYFRVCWWSRRKSSRLHEAVSTRDDGTATLYVACLKVWHQENAEIWAERQPGFLSIESCERLTVVPTKSTRVT